MSSTISCAEKHAHIPWIFKKINRKKNAKKVNFHFLICTVNNRHSHYCNHVKPEHHSAGTSEEWVSTCVLHWKQPRDVNEGLHSQTVEALWAQAKQKTQPACHLMERNISCVLKVIKMRGQTTQRRYQTDIHNNWLSETAVGDKEPFLRRGRKTLRGHLPSELLRHIWCDAKCSNSWCQLYRGMLYCVPVWWRNLCFGGFTCL